MNSFDQHITFVPDQWRGPLTEVADTTRALQLLLKDLDIENPELLLGLTKLVLERYDDSAK